MMNRIFITILLIYYCYARIIDESNPSFVRSAIESNPWEEEKWEASQKIIYKNLMQSFGSETLPLRTAVENVPYIPSHMRIPLRDAVEFRPWDAAPHEYRDHEDDIEYMRVAKARKQKSNEFAAYVRTTQPDGAIPEERPYRADDPYQQIIDPAPYFSSLAKYVDESSFYDDSETLKSGRITSRPFQFQPADEVKASNDKQYHVFCFYASWAFYRDDKGKFVPENMDSKLCTHNVYSFATLDPQTLTMKEFDPWADIENQLYKRFVDSNKVNNNFIAIGGWTDSAGDKYSRLVSNASSRRNFITKAVEFLKKYGFDGIHIDWNYPVCWQSDCKRGDTRDKANYAKFIEELSEEFYQEDLFLSCALSGYKEVITEAYDLPRLSDACDYLVAMTYDYHGSWETETGHIAPLYAREGDKYPQYNVDYTMNLLVEGGVNKDKLIMGVPMYGQSFTLTQHRNELVGEGTSASGAGQPGEITRQPGMFAYYECCRRVKKDFWKSGRDPTGKSGPYATYQNQWVGYDDIKYVTIKAEYVKRKGYGGIGAWTIDLEDFNNECCDGPFPLLTAVNKVFGRISKGPTQNDCTKPPTPVTPVAPVMTPPIENGEWKPTQPSTQSTTWPGWVDQSTTQKTTTKSTTTTPKSTTTTKRSTTTTTTTKRTTTTSKKPTTPSYVPQSSTIPPPGNVAQPPPSSNDKCDSSMGLQPILNNCNAYYECVMGVKTVRPCPGGLHFNRKRKQCDWPADAKCVESTPPVHIEHDEPVQQMTTTTKRSTTTRRKKPSKAPTVQATQPTTTTQQTTTTQKPTTTRRSTTTKHTTASSVKPPSYPQKPISKKCKSGERYPHRDCNKFSTCINGIKLTQSCPTSLQWNNEQQTCDYEDTVKCVSKAKLEQLDNSYYKMALSRLVETEGKCNGIQFLKYYASCSVYLECVHGQVIMRECPNSLEWNDSNKNCDWPTNANCQASNKPGTFGVVDESVDMNQLAPKPSTTTRAPTTTTSTEKPVLSEFSGDYKLVCYFTNWAWYRRGIGKYTPDNIDTDLCTHIVYGFAVLDYSKLTIRTHDSWADIDNKFYTRVTDLKNRGVKVTLALGGWNDSLGDKYSRLVRSAEARARFVNHAIEFLEKYGFEGLDLDWEYPVCWQVDCKKGFPDEKEGFTALVRELSEAFKPRGLLLSSAVSPSKTVIDAGYDVPELSKYFDWIAVMCYDYHGQWDKKTGHVAPLYYHPEDDISYFNTNFTINYWIELGAPPKKLVMGMPLYGQSFQLENTNNHGLNARAPGPGQAGEFTRAAGFLAQYEICDKILNQDWTVVEDPLGRMGPYAYKGNQWVSYDDEDTLRRKSHYIRHMGLGGGMVWALDLDDFKNRCGQGHHPLLRVIRDVLAKKPRPVEEIPPPSYSQTQEIEYQDEAVTHSTIKPSTSSGSSRKPTKSKRPKTTTTRTTTTAAIAYDEPEPAVEDIEQNQAIEMFDENEVEEIDNIDDQLEEHLDFKVVCYFTNWAWYRQDGGKFLPEDINTDLCTHIVYGFAVLDRDSLTIKTHDSWADLDNNFYKRVVDHKKKGAKVTVAIGGWNDSAGDKYSRLVRDAAARARFIRHVIQFIERYEFDGLDLDWEYPVCWQVDCNKGYPDEKSAFTALVRELSVEFKKKGLLLSTAVSPSKKVIDAGYEVEELSKYFDWIAVMTYDFHGQWDKKTGHIAPMYEHPDDFEKTFNTNFTINYWISQGAPPRKLVMGIPMYGQSFSLADKNNNGLNAQTYGGGEAGAATRSRGFLAYYEICKYIREKQWTVVRDLQGRMGPYAYSRDQWVSFDDIPMVHHKSQYVQAMGLGGAMIWALDLDDFRNVCDCEDYPLLKTINRVLRNYPPAEKTCKLESVNQVFRPDKPTYSDAIQPTKPPKKPKPSRKPSTKPTSAPMADVVETFTTSTKRPRKTKETRKPSTPPVTVPSYAPQGINHDEIGNLPQGATCDGQKFLPHKKDCNRYYMCDQGIAIEKKCDPVLHWHAEADRCDWPKDANCKVSGTLNNDETTTTKKPPRRTKPPRKTTTSTTPQVVYNEEKPVSNEPSKKPKPPKKPSASNLPSPTLNEPIGPGEYKVVCYFTNWAWYRPGIGKYTPDHIDTDLCTHVVYGFAVLNGETLTIKTHDSWADIDNRFYERVASLKSKGVKVTLALGGWNDSLGDKYSRLVRNPAARARFVTHAIEFVEKYGFQGLDLDWEYPVCWQVDCKKGKADEKEGFAALVRELSEAFKPRGLLLSSAVSPSKMVIDAGYDVPTLAKYFDWIAVMTYDYHGQWDKKTGHVAPLYYHPEDDIPHFNSNFTIHYWIEQGAPPKKLVMGVPLYGQTFGLADQNNHGLNAKSYGPGEAGKYTRAGGFLAFYEICAKINGGGFTVVRDPEGRMGPYAYRGAQWFSYDDVEDVRRKAEFIKEMGLGGGMVWALDLDDFTGLCGCGPHPLLRALNSKLDRISEQSTTDCT